MLRFLISIALFVFCRLAAVVSKPFQIFEEAINKKEICLPTSEP